MTPLQNACLIAIRDLTVDGIAPTYEELQLHLGLSSKSHVSRLIDALLEQRLVHRTPGRSRNIYVVSPTGPSDPEIAAMSDDVLVDLMDRVEAALLRRRPLSQAMREMAA